MTIFSIYASDIREVPLRNPMLGLLGKFVSLDKLVSLENVPHWGPIRRAMVRSVMSSESNRKQVRDLAKSFGRARYDEEFHSQFDSVLDLADPVLDDLLELTRYREPCDRFMGRLIDWRNTYKGAMDNTASSEAFVTLTEKQYHSVEPKIIGHNPEFSLMHHYAQIHPVLLHTTVRVGKHKKHRENLYAGMDGLQELHERGKEVFEALPSCMGRRGHLGDLMLYELQNLDSPVNCNPSYHIADSFYLMSLVGSWNLPDDCASVYVQSEELARYMIPTVMKIMQHTASDIAGGLVLAKLMCSEMGISFRDPFAYLEKSGVTEEYPAIPWSLIRRNYDDLSMFVRNADHDLVAGVKKLYKKNGCLLTKPGEYNKYLGRVGGKTVLVDFDESS